ncbi:MAG: extracellular solute-binding protein [Spirochaetales bacterium]
MKRIVAASLTLLFLASAMLFAAGEQEPAGGAIGGEITVLTNRTDIVNTTFAEYGTRFQEIYPDVEINFEAMQLIRDNTDAIPYYTNYASGWALDQWECNRTAISGDADYVNSMAHVDDPFAPGRPHYTLYKLLYDLVAQGLTEDDSTTTDWESTKIWIGEGRIAAMVLGSWAIGRVQDLAENPDDVGYTRFPHNVDGQVYASSGGDYSIAVNRNSDNKATALAYLWWFLNDSGYAREQGSIPTRRGPQRSEGLP